MKQAERAQPNSKQNYPKDLFIGIKVKNDKLNLKLGGNTELQFTWPTTSLSLLLPLCQVTVIFINESSLQGLV